MPPNNLKYHYCHIEQSSLIQKKMSFLRKSQFVFFMSSVPVTVEWLFRKQWPIETSSTDYVYHFFWTCSNADCLGLGWLGSRSKDEAMSGTR